MFTQMRPTSNLLQPPRVLVVGAGVSGLTTALCLRRKGCVVTVIADQFAPQVTSVVAGALWEWPPAVCGSHQDERSLTRSKAWAATGYSIFRELSAKPGTGVYFRPVNFYFKKPVAQLPGDFRKMNEFKDKVDGFVHDPKLIGEHGINPALGLRDAYQFLSPTVDTDVYMRWLLAEAREARVTLLQRHVSGALADQVPELRREFDADWVVNCSGLGARELANDDVYPLRGALVRLLNDFTPPLRTAHCMSHDDTSGEPFFIFILPRGENRILLGGIAEPNQWEKDIHLDNYAPIREMFRRCVEFLPSLASATLDAAEPVRVGLRPVRRQNVRLDREGTLPLIHNYGHGGSGVTFSWGCAEEVAEMIAGTSVIRGIGQVGAQTTTSTLFAQTSGK
jgi:D-amino-acid oxidase